MNPITEKQLLTLVTKAYDHGLLDVQCGNTSNMEEIYDQWVSELKGLTLGVTVSVPVNNNARTHAEILSGPYRQLGCGRGYDCGSTSLGDPWRRWVRESDIKLITQTIDPHLI
jgi:hypothetical protein